MGRKKREEKQENAFGDGCPILSSKRIWLWLGGLEGTELFDPHQPGGACQGPGVQPLPPPPPPPPGLGALRAKSLHSQAQREMGSGLRALLSGGILTHQRSLRTRGPGICIAVPVTDCTHPPALDGIPNPGNLTQVKCLKRGEERTEGREGSSLSLGELLLRFGNFHLGRVSPVASPQSQKRMCLD